MTLITIILYSIAAALIYGAIAGMTMELYPKEIKIFNFDFDKDAIIAWACVWPIAWLWMGTFHLVLFICMRPFKFGQWLVKKIDEKFDIRK